MKLAAYPAGREPAPGGPCTGGHAPPARAGAGGRYRFQSDPPEHIHMLVSAEGFEPLTSNRYHPEGRAAGRFDVVLPPSMFAAAQSVRVRTSNVRTWVAC